MPLSDAEYADVLKHARRVLRQHGLSAMDERALSSLRQTEGPYSELAHYLRALIGEFSLGSDAQYRAVMQRIRENTRGPESGGIQGIRVDVTPKEVSLYGMDPHRPYLELGPSPRAQGAVSRLAQILQDMDEDWHHEPNGSPEGNR